MHQAGTVRSSLKSGYIGNQLAIATYCIIVYYFARYCSRSFMYVLGEDKNLNLLLSICYYQNTIIKAITQSTICYYQIVIINIILSIYQHV